MALQHLRSSTANKRPTPAGMSDGQLALNTNNASPGLFFKDSNGALVKIGPVHVGTTAPNATPGAGGSSGNAVGEQWLDTSGANPILKVWNGSAWQAASGGASVTTSDTAPSSPSDGDLWYDSVGGRLYVYYQDPNGSQWVDASPQASGTSITTGNTSAQVIDTGSDGRFVVTTEGSERLRVDSSGRVGIGTTSAGGILHTLTTGSDNVNFFERASGAKFGIYNSSVNSYIGTFSNHDLRLATNDTERARIDTSGRLLIGTSSTSAASRAVLQGNSFDSNGGCILKLARGNNSPNSGGDLGNIEFTDSGHSFAASISAKRDGGTWTSGSSQPTRLEFSTTVDGASSPTERMRINNSGGVLINTTTHRDSARLVVDGDGSSVNSVWYAPSTSSYSVLYFRNPNGNTGRIDLSGTTTSYVTTSDYRLKENIEPVTNGIARLQQLKPSRFNFIVDPDKTVDGFIAHEVQEVVPEAISGEKDAVDADGNPVYQGIDQSKLVPLLTAALQEAIGEIESLKARVAALESA